MHLNTVHLRCGGKVHKENGCNFSLKYAITPLYTWSHPWVFVRWRWLVCVCVRVCPHPLRAAMPDPLAPSCTLHPAAERWCYSEPRRTSAQAGSHQPREPFLLHNDQEIIKIHSSIKYKNVEWNSLSFSIALRIKSALWIMLPHCLGADRCVATNREHFLIPERIHCNTT